MTAKSKQSNCPKCNNRYEKCADGETCPKWRISYDVCIIFGTRPFRSGFSGAGIIRR